MQTVKINENGTLVIPKTLRSTFKPSDELAWFSEGDTLIFKRIMPVKLSEIALRVKEKPAPINKIAEEVSLYRKNKRTK